MAITTLRPDADGDANWPRTPASGSRWEKLDDTPVDTSTYISNPGARQLHRLEFGQISLTAPDANGPLQRIKSIQPRLVLKYNGQAYHPLEFTRSGARGRLTWVKQAAAASAILGAAGGSGEWNGPVWSRDPDGNEWTEWSINTLWVHIGEGSTTPADRIRIYEMYVDVDVRNRPTVGTLTTTGTVAGTRPTFGWDHADSDGDPQNWFTVRVWPDWYTQRPGFDPSRSDGVVWQAQDVCSTAESVQCGVDLQVGVTYRWYVWVGKDWPQSSTGRWYSAPANTTFQVALARPNPPSLSRTVDDTRALVRLVADSRANMFGRNAASLETSAADWPTVSGCTAARSTTQALHGNASLLVTATGSADMSVTSAVQGGAGSPARVRPGLTYSAVAYCKAPNPLHARPVTLRIDWRDEAGTVLSSTTGEVSGMYDSAWAPVWVSGVAPAGASKWTLTLTFTAPSTGWAIYVDQIGMWPGSGQPDNLLTTAQSGFGSGVGTWAVGANCTLTTTTPVPALNGASLRIQSAAAGDARADHVSAATSGIPVAPDQTYTILGHMRPSSASWLRTFELGVRWFNEDGTFLSASTATAATSGTRYTPVSTDVVAPDGARWAVVTVAAKSCAAANEVFFVDSVYMVPGELEHAFGWGPGIGDLARPDLIRTVVEQQDVLGPNFLPANVASAGEDGTTTGWAAGTSDRLESVGVDSRQGARCIRWTPAAAGNDLWFSSAAAEDAFDADRAPLVAPGQTMRAAVWVRAETGTFSTQLRFEVCDQYGAVLTSVASSTPTVGTSWQQLVAHSMVVPDRGVYARLSLRNSGGEGGAGVLLVDQAQLEIGTGATPATWHEGTGDRPDEWETTRGGGHLNPLTTPDQRHWLVDGELLRGLGIRAHRGRNVLQQDEIILTSPAATVASYQSASDGTWWLKDPFHPGRSMQVNVRLVPSKREDQTEVFAGLGSDRKTMVTHATGGIDGTLTLEFAGRDEWVAGLRLLSAPYPLLLQGPDGTPDAVRWIAAPARDLQPQNPAGIYVISELPFVNVDRPSDPPEDTTSSLVEYVTEVPS